VRRWKSIGQWAFAVVMFVVSGACCCSKIAMHVRAPGQMQAFGNNRVAVDVAVLDDAEFGDVKPVLEKRVKNDTVSQWFSGQDPQRRTLQLKKRLIKGGVYPGNPTPVTFTLPNEHATHALIVANLRKNPDKNYSPLVLIALEGDQCEFSFRVEPTGVVQVQPN